MARDVCRGRSSRHVRARSSRQQARGSCGRRPASTRTTSAASSRARKGRRPACGSSPRRRTCRRSSCRIVVTDDRGRYLVPDLPKATYDVWVRGYGLVDSPKVTAAPGKMLNLTAVTAPNPRAAARNTTRRVTGFRSCRVPDKSEFPGHRPERQRHLARHEEPGRMDCAAEVGWLHCLPSARHQGHARDAAGARARSIHRPTAWERRLQSGQAGADMVRGAQSARARSARSRLFADWTDRIAAGEVPPAPPRPQGIERNVVITEWDWARSEGVSARRGLDRSAQSDAQRRTA